ncbi:TonB-dependent receptor [Sunxiuqinia elliptica]|uniref:Outer membrane receptor protein involved in Fe transport n=1 Tax=Sunxiuqinia elliptica TaxID=655355 RepID=A0A4R6GPF7_9BACT|nr:TonB-dependent receptor [Sunxiuqinia elliptica]TDN97162.1 outer membrane receptor protein involved in Fe transport [Sunxiuqinia elliptica]TDO60654.1 outer membrane receptor protein involved in Fe transport [Sunxiuqinia elliptica]
MSLNKTENITFVRMKLKKTYLLSLLCLFIAFQSFAQNNNATVYGTITNTKGQAIELANVSIKNYPIGTTTDQKGAYLLRIPAKKKVNLVFSFIGHQSVERSVQARSEERIELNIQLTESSEEIEEVQVSRRRKGAGNINRIDPKFTNILPDASSSGVEALIKTLPGVSSNNELSSQYSVRGGNFDENLVYVNDIEIYRPFLVRSGKQEGLSFINSDMVSTIEFSAGAFDAKYGDKMASVLDIKYRTPTEFAGSASASLLGGSIHLEDISKNKKLSYTGGLRYKTNSYLVGSLDEKGEYDPSFVDFQTYVTYRFSDAFDLSFLGNIARNDYHFIPESRETSFGTYQTVYNTKIFFEGQEKDRFATSLGALSANYHPNNNLNLKFIASAFQTKEEVNYDILGFYYLNQLESDLAEEAAEDSVLNLGVGSFLNHARNKLVAEVYSFSHKGAYNTTNHLLNWGVKLQLEDIHDQMNEWEMRDSTGYSLPYSDETVNLFRVITTNNKMNTVRVSGHIQDTYEIPINHGELYLTGGARFHYWDYTNEFLVSPRLAINYYPDWESRFVFRLAGGSYQQPAFFKELKDRDGNIASNIKAQKSTQFVLGSDYLFTAWDRPFKLTSELYYKNFSHLTPYQIENVQIRYLGDQEAKGYAAGLDFKVNGEFVSGVQSWASVSLLQTKEDIVGDSHGWIPRPTDQTLNISVFFQDYFPGNPTYKMHLAAFYGSRLPTGPPNSERYQDTFRMPPYRRIDLGFSKVLIGPETRVKSKLFSHIKDMSLGLEVLNLIGVNNTVSYFWVSSNKGDLFAVPNYLTDRKLNLKLTVKF